MATQSLAQPPHEPTTRTDRGHRLYADHADAIRFERGVWLVPSEHALTSVYEVRLGRRRSCECKDFEFHGGGEPCKHIHAATLAQADRADKDLRIDYPVEEELLAACEHVLSWFEEWEEHADHAHDLGGEHDAMKRLRRAVRLAREEG